MWNKIVKKTINAKAKASLQPLFETRKIDSKYLKGYKPLTKKDKDNISWKYCNEAFNIYEDKAKYHNSSFANQFQTQAPKKDK